MDLNGLIAVVVLLLMIGLPLVLVTLAVARSARFAERRKQLMESVIIAEYEPPAGLTPAELGFMFDARFDRDESVATILDLEQRGVVTIDLEGKVGLNTPQAPAQILKPHEKLILNEAAGNLNIKDIRNTQAFRDTVKASLTGQGYLPKGSLLAYRARRGVVAYLAIATPIYIGLVATAKPEGRLLSALTFFVFVYFGAWPFFIILAAVATYMYGRMVGQPGLRTPKLKALWPEIEGYREFVKRVDLDELRFDSEELKTVSKDKTLPYAVALGLKTDWQKRFS